MAKKIWPVQSLWYLILILISGNILTACGAAEPPLPTSSPMPAPQLENNTEASSAPAYPAPGDAAPGYPAPDDAASGYPAPAETAKPESVERTPPPSFPGKLAYHSEATGSLQIFTLNGTNGLVEQRLQTASQAFEPSWSPDCQELTFSSGAGGNDFFKLYTVQSGNDSAEILAAGSDFHYWAPAWSPTGEMIAYQNNEDQLMNVCFVNPDGTELGCLARDSFSNAMPSWSPDGSKLLFTSNRDGDWEIFLTDYPPTGEVVQLTDNNGVDFYPRFSPDGSRIAFAAKRTSNYDIYTMNADGSDEIQLTSDILDDTTPAWVGDDRIAFSSARTEDWELYLMNADGSELSRLTFQTGMDQHPTWCPSD